MDYSHKHLHTKNMIIIIKKHTDETLEMILLDNDHRLFLLDMYKQYYFELLYINHHYMMLLNKVLLKIKSKFFIQIFFSLILPSQFIPVYPIRQKHCVYKLPFVLYRPKQVPLFKHGLEFKHGFPIK